jgi:hypothetical protein
MWQGCAVPPRSRPTQLGKKDVLLTAVPSLDLLRPLPASSHSMRLLGAARNRAARGSSSFPPRPQGWPARQVAQRHRDSLRLDWPSPPACAGGLTGVTWCEQFCAPVNPSCTQDQQQDTDADAPCTAVQRSWGTVVLTPQLMEEALLCHSAVQQCSAPTTGSSRPLRPKLSAHRPGRTELKTTSSLCKQESVGLMTESNVAASAAATPSHGVSDLDAHIAARRAAAERARRWRLDNPEKWALSRKSYARRHPEVQRESTRRWRACRRAERLLAVVRELLAGQCELGIHVGMPTEVEN